MGAQISKIALSSDESIRLYKRYVHSIPADYIHKNPVIIPNELNAVVENFKKEYAELELVTLNILGPKLISEITDKLLTTIKLNSEIPLDFKVVFKIKCQFLASDLLDKEMTKILVKALEIDAHWNLRIMREGSYNNLDISLKLTNGCGDYRQYAIKFSPKPFTYNNRYFNEKILYQTLVPGFNPDKKDPNLLQIIIMDELGMFDSKFSPENECVICLDRTPNIKFNNCQHTCICSMCMIQGLDKCPVCRSQVSDFTKLD